MAKTLSDKVREKIPQILKNKEELSFNELFEELSKYFPELNDSFEPRYGVLRGVLNKVDKIKIPNLGIKKINNNVFYYYNIYANEQKNVQEIFSSFKNELIQNKALEIDLVNQSKKSIESLTKIAIKIKELEELIKDL